MQHGGQSAGLVHPSATRPPTFARTRWHQAGCCRCTAGDVTFSDLPGEHFSSAGRSPTEGSTSEGWVSRMADDSWFPGRIDDHGQWQDLAACRGMRTKVFFHSERERGRRGVAGRQQPRRYATVARSSLACRAHAPCVGRSSPVSGVACPPRNAEACCGPAGEHGRCRLQHTGPPGP